MRQNSTSTSRLARAICIAAAAGSAAVILNGAAARADESLAPVAAITLPNGQKITSFDISYTNPQLGIYILGDRTSKAVDVVNTKSNTLIMQAGQGSFTGVARNPNGSANNDKSGPDGVLVVMNKEIWAGDGDSTMKVLSLFTGDLVATIPTGGVNRVDEMCYDPVENVVMAANNADDPPFGTIFNVRTKTIRSQLKFDGTNGTLKSSNGAEQCGWSPRTNKFYITIPEVNGPGDNSAPGGVIQIDPASGRVTGTTIIPIANCSGPQGLAIGPGSQILIGCNGGPPGTPNSVVVIDDGSGAPFGTILATIPNEVGADMVDYNPATSHYTLAKRPAGAPQSIGMIDALSFAPDPDLPSGVAGGGSNHSIASDPVTNQYYFPVASNSGATLCSSVGGIDAQGCILVLKSIAGTETDTDPTAHICPAQGTPVVNVRGFSPEVLTTVCR